jgi:hypothetical protein
MTCAIMSAISPTVLLIMSHEISLDASRQMRKCFAPSLVLTYCYRRLGPCYRESEAHCRRI